MKCFLTVVKKPLQSKALLAMKLTVLLTLFFALNVSANGFGQNKISIRVKKAEIAGVLSSIEKQTNYRFLYNNDLEDIREKVSLNVKDAPLDQVLDLVLQKTRLLYQLMDNNLIVIKEDPNAPVRVPDVVIRGKVTGEGGAPLAGASVQVKGTTTGTTTNNDGVFTISVADANVTLVISSVGYEQQEVALAGRTDITVALTTSTKEMDQVVVIGYGTAAKRDLTGSIVKIGGKEVQDKPNTNPVASLQSKVAGLYVVNNGTPGAAPDIRIRGTGSIGQIAPLYVVDGILQDNIDYINPNDIESIEVLKDPSSLAIFGVRGANGVIAVTTKRGKAGQMVINVNTAYGFKKLVDKIKMSDADQFDELFAEENANNSVPTPDYSALTGNTDWIDEVTRTGKYSSTNLSISSSTEKNRFNLGVGYISDEGIIRHEKLTRMLLSFSDEAKVSKAVKLGLNLNLSRQNNPYNATGILDQARKVMPHISPDTKRFRVKDPYSADSIDLDIYSGLATAFQNSGVVNPILELENTWDKRVSRENRYVGSVYVDMNFLKNFNFRATWYADVSYIENRSYTPLYYAYDPMTNTPYLYSTKTSVNQSTDNYRKFQQDYILTYKKRFGDHNLTAMGGFTTYFFGFNGQSGVSNQGTTPTSVPIPDNPNLWYLNNGFGTIPLGGANSAQYERTTVSGLARVLYNYQNKYFLNASLRNDASSRIPEPNRSQLFWSVGAAWEIGKERFMASQTFFDYLKLKVSAGVLGNQSTYGLVGDYPSYPGVNQATAYWGWANPAYGQSDAYKVNPGLKWETINAKEVGIEFNAFKNRLHVEFNYFDKVTKDMMTYLRLASLGIPDELKNGGEIHNWGQELMATWNQKISNDFSVNISGNITFMKNKLISVAEGIPGGYLSESSQNNNSAEARTLPGQPIGSFFGYIVEGVYQSQLDILNSPINTLDPKYRPGDLKFKDISGPDGKPDGLIDAKDRTVIGNPSPDFVYGGSIGANYKGFTLSVDFGGVYGNEVFRTWGSLESPFQRVNYPSIKLERWHGAGTSNWEPLLSQADRLNYNGSTLNIEDGSYFRIRNLQVGYDINSKALNKIKVKSLRLFANIQNLKTWKHTNGYTAEYGGSAVQFGFDYGGGAIPRITTFGLNATF